MKLLAWATLVFLLLTMGCGLVIRFGGAEFSGAGSLRGHMTLGGITLILLLGFIWLTLHSG